MTTFVRILPRPPDVPTGRAPDVPAGAAGPDAASEAAGALS
ncbi:hypothetical protein [Allostreptomyces psammosilenae]|uniref:Uncharacterized protein n=1 Tax=Allostreptomyces psammosilenae TaxID=1892865 RepID=A0A852ZYS0_9ACTN|nr:hypothetical protein [Allostreptomyces psammosilenae]NYI07533.1 hypothetical protein [Allostreptomyces psammosilenae]